MSKKPLYAVIAAVCITLPFGSFAADGDATAEIAEYLKNLGLYQGYDLTSAPQNQNPANPLVEDVKLLQPMQWQVFNTFLGAKGVSAFAKAAGQLVPSQSPLALLNVYANLAYVGTNNTDAQAGTPSFWFSPLIDQKSYQLDPVTQSIVNVLGTPPDDGVCPSGGNNQPCALNRSAVVQNIMGDTPPNENCFFSYYYTQPFVNQLNANMLLGPLLYSSEPITPQKPSSDDAPAHCPPATPQFAPQTQMEQAAAFVRYATGTTLPFSLPSVKDVYRNLYADYFKAPDSPDGVAKRNMLQNYLGAVRIFAAQKSVAVANLYSLLSKRVPQNDPFGQAPPTSQALSEFNLASWRLFNIDKKLSKTGWIQQINNAAPESVQKEMAILLAEMNYQLYLNRQLQERILLTNTMVLMQLMKTNLPTLSVNEPTGGLTQ